MTKICELTGKSVMSGNKVSHAVNRTRRKFLPNLQMVSLASDLLGRSLRLRISMAALRAVEHQGGIDSFLMRAAPDQLSARAHTHRKQLLALHTAKAAGEDFVPAKRRKAASAKSQKAKKPTAKSDNASETKAAPASNTNPPDEAQAS